MVIDWVMIAIWAGLTVLADLVRPKPDIENAKPAGLGDFRFPTATEGRYVPLIWGTVRCEGPNVVWWGDLVQQARTRSVKTGLFSSQDQIIGFEYYMGVQQALCMGPVDEMRRVWIGDDLVYSAVGIASAVVAAPGTGYSVDDILTVSGGTSTVAGQVKVKSIGALGIVTSVLIANPGEYSVFPSTTAATTGGGGSGCTVTLTFGSAITHGDTFTITRPDLFGGPDLGSGGIAGTFRFHSGTFDQAVSSYLSTYQKEPVGTGDTPAYRDICYVAPDTTRSYFGTSTSIKPWKWELRRTPNGLSLGSGMEVVNDGDANPVNVLYEALTNADWGYGISSSDIDTSDFTTQATTLYNEGNGFSFLLDREEDAAELIRRLEGQIDGITFLNPLTGKWQLKLLRDDYDIDTVPQVTQDTNLLEVSTFTRGTWEGTSNQVRTPFNDRNDDYKDTYGFAQDMANVRILGANVTVSPKHGGIKNRTLANAIAWRELKGLAVPLANAQLVVDRSLYGVLPGDVVALTDSDLGVTKFPVRIRGVDYGDLLDGRITIDGVQDVFQSGAGSFGDPPGSGWQDPDATLADFPTDERLVFEAPRALTLRDPNSTDPETDKVYAAARRQGSEVTFVMSERNAAGTPSGSYAEFGEVYQFMLVGELTNDLDIAAANPVTSALVTPDPDTQSDVLAAFPAVTDLVELGTDLLSLCMIEDEFVLVESAEVNSGDVQLNNVYRGVLDSVQADHSSGAKVYLVFVGAGISSGTVLAGNNVDVKLIPKSAKQQLPVDAVSETAFQMDDRTRRPYPPASFDLNGTTLDTTSVDLDGSGSGEDVGILVDEIVRRDLRTVDEIEALGTDAGTLFADFPSANSTTVEVQARDGVTALTTTTGISGTSTTIRQLDILAGLDETSLPASLTMAVRQSHTLDSTVYTSRDWLAVTFTVASEFVGKHAFGELDESVASTNDFVVVADTVDHVFTLSSSFTSGDVEYRINGGSWVTLISSGGTGPGTVPNASLSASDTIGIRHLSTDTDPQKLLRMTVSGTEEAYAVLIS